MKNITLLAFSFCAAATSYGIVWDGGGGDGLWSNPLNWDTDAVPTSSDNVVIDNATVTINSPAQANQIALGNSGTSTVTLNINSSLNWYDAFSSQDWGVAGDTIVVNVNSGGVLNGGGTSPTTQASRIDGTATINIATDGVLTNLYRQRTGLNVNLVGGTFFPYASSAGARTGSNYILNNGIIGGSSGTIVFALAGNGVNTGVGPSSGTTFDLADLTVAFEIIDGYTPQVGDAFDLYNIATGATADLGDGSNIASTTLDGNWLITWDTSQWNPGGVARAQLAILDVVAIPEPSFYAVILGVAALALVRRRR